MAEDRAHDSRRVPDVLKGRVTDTQAEWETTMKSIRASLNADAAYESDQKNSKRFDEGHRGIV